MIDAATFIGEPLIYGPIKIYPPTVRDVISNERFQYYKTLLTISQEEIEDQMTERGESLENMLTPFGKIIALCKESQEGTDLVKQAFFFFTHEEVEILTDIQLILFGKAEEVIKTASSINDLIFLREQEFLEFQNAIRGVCGEEPKEPPNPNEHPKIKAMKAKARLRDRIKAKSKDAITFSDCLTSICCMGIGITPLNIGELSYASVNALIERYQEKEKYQLDIESLLAGADSKKIKPKYWIRNLN